MSGEFADNQAVPLVVGAVLAGVTKKVTKEIVRGLRDQLSQPGRPVNLKMIRFIPSTRAYAGDGSFQVVANAFFDVTPDGNVPPRSEALDSVVTVGRLGRAQKLESVTIPALRRAAL